MEATCYSPEQAKDLFEQRQQILDRIYELVDEVNALAPQYDQLLEQGYLPQHILDDDPETDPADLVGMNHLRVASLPMYLAA